MMKIKLKAISLLLFYGTSCCWAASIGITNNSFELPAQSFGGIANGVATGWTVSNSNAGVWFPATGPNNGFNFFSSVPDANQVLFVGFGSPADVNQSLGVSLLANTTYTLSYFVGQRYDLPFSVYSVAFDAGVTTLASDSGGAPTSGNFVQRTITFTTGASPVAGTLNIDISATGHSATGAGAQADFDLFTLTTSTNGGGGVPEPATVSLMLGGLAVIVFSKRRLHLS